MIRLIERSEDYDYERELTPKVYNKLKEKCQFYKREIDVEEEFDEKYRI